MSSKGGSRPGAGRPSKPAPLRSEIVSLRLPAWLVDELKSRRKGVRDLGKVIENGLLVGYRLKRKRNQIEKEVKGQ